ncbi:hypothetical protein DYB30_012200 [Aphanomyces astaci]|uniref:PLOD1-3-like GT domain-containing protein n=1 Tax=Aphanomyces astaci TaxID=112090 RepID=A0A397CNZ8_APHAT|nr:hypothetical protein DYB38_013136 [Aphanomyces astaci]RHY49556.1 hypothetical protein DYB30_012200 [Aphanomyces astaci]RHY72017.1 hypothetical protein DYB34_013926 [Aphanomyces astaci]RHZ09146.1 hypothetical protein DYB31_014939 [Aphanomyces astaci]
MHHHRSDTDVALPLITLPLRRRASFSRPHKLATVTLALCLLVGATGLSLNVSVLQQPWGPIHPSTANDRVRHADEIAQLHHNITNGRSNNSTNRNTPTDLALPTPKATVFTTPAPTTTTPQPPTPKPTTMIPGFVPRKLRFLTLADNPRPEICLLAASVFAYESSSVLEVLGWNYSSTFFDGTTCGQGCANKRDGKQYRHGQQKKLHWLSHYFEKNPELHDDDLVLFTDAWDVVVQDDPQKLTQLFLQQTKLKRGVIFNGEPSCGDSFGNGGNYGNQLRQKKWTIQLTVDQKPRVIAGQNMCSAVAAKTASTDAAPGPNWSLGSGGFLGDVRSIRAFLRRITEIRVAQEKDFFRLANASAFADDPAFGQPLRQSFLFEGDQILFQIAYLKYPEVNVLVDTAADIFFVMSYLIGSGSGSSGCTSLYFHDQVPSKFTWNDVQPVFFHFPGDFKPMFPRCANATAKYRRAPNPGKYFYDVDRQHDVAISSICPDYS